MLHDLNPRLYQQTIFSTAAQKNTLVVLPTGLGKTAIALLLAAQRLSLYPQRKILLLAPTKPLCEQHLATFRKYIELEEDKIVLFTGSVAPEKRGQLWSEAQIIISTPQGLENDVINRRVKLEEVSLLVFDEAHHATGDYPYSWLAQQYEKVSSTSRILALTASPGSDLEKIREVCTNLKIEKVELRTENDPDVRPYVQKIKLNWISVDFPLEFQKVQKFLEECKKVKIKEAHQLGYCSSLSPTKSDLLRLQGELQGKISQGERNFEILRSISLVAETIKVEHALELLESQGVKQLHSYLSGIIQEASSSKVKAVKNLAIDPNFLSAFSCSEELLANDSTHPKLLKLKDLVSSAAKNNPLAKIIIFTQFRNSAEEIIAQLKSLGSSDLKVQIFVGQAKKNGLGFSQKEQKEILDRFRNGEFNVLVATSVAEEGLDIPKVDEVIFYEPVPSAIRSIQRRGRTGRLEKGEVTVLITKGTRDEAYRWSSHHKEKRMFSNLEKVRKGFILSPEDSGQPVNKSPNNPDQNLSRYLSSESRRSKSSTYPPSSVLILADHREKDNRIVKELIGLGVEVKTAQLESADYVLSGKVGVELKKVPDFVSSIIDGRLLEQMKQLKNNFPKSVLIIEGEEDIYSIRKVHANSIRGMLSSIVLDYKVPILYTKNPLDTAYLLAIMAKREQGKEEDYASPVFKPKTLAEQQEFIISSLPNIGIKTAKLLLERFGSIRNLINSSKEDLLKIEGIGEKTAEKLRELFEAEYKKKE
jgi:Fanconi anemia group M protein